MSDTYRYYNIFSPEGKLLQVEHSLEALNNSHPVLIVKNHNTIITVTKKQKLDILTDKENEGNPHFFKVNNTLHGLITGIPADIDQIKYKISNMSINKEYNLGFEVDSRILSRAFADKIQKLIQSTGERPLCFGLVLFDNLKENLANMYYVDTSAVCYPYKGIGIGENHSKINKYLEKKLIVEAKISLLELEEIALEAMAESIGNDFGPNDVEMGCLNIGGELNVYTSEVIDGILLRISEKD